MKFADKLSEALETPELPDEDQWRTGPAPHTYLQISSHKWEATKEELNAAAKAAAESLEKYGFINFVNVTGDWGFLSSGTGVEYEDLVTALNEDDEFKNVTHNLRIMGKLTGSQSAFEFMDNDVKVTVKLWRRPWAINFGEY